MGKLAILGGEPVRKKPFPGYNIIGEEEQNAVSAVLDSGILSRYIGGQHPDFMGGPVVQSFEAAWAEAFSSKHALAVNSATSGLYAAVGAAGVGPGDEIIVSPYTMMASATAAIVYNAVPVFADIDPNTFCLSVESIKEKITPRTRAIIIVHIFGQPADMDPIMELAKFNNILVIEDAAQAPFATYKGQPVGTLGDIGVFSLNYHKHIHTGEGGVVTTNDPELAERVSLIRNHAEAVVGKRGTSNIVNMVGFNFRMGEIEAAIGLCQLKKGPSLVEQRCKNISFLERKLRDIPFLAFQECAEDVRHVYYVHPIKFNGQVSGLKRETFVAAIKAELPETELREGEGALIGAGYVRPIYLEPMYQQKIAFGENGYPFTHPSYDGTVNYEKGICPETEKAHFETLITHEMMRPPMSEDDLNDVAAAFHKINENLPQLREFETNSIGS
ncbi:MAG: DegT/DnrJ/EryC1/StrS aminotransferase [Magnetovibrio sp.]|nr:DegT/DnrJ/EryC1/StrS aminotransferase [Magnetovibrio sp.]